MSAGEKDTSADHCGPGRAADVSPRPRSYSTDGPECPRCGFTFTPDETVYYEPSYTEDECQECGCRFDVEVHHSVAWACTAKPA